MSAGGAAFLPRSVRFPIKRNGNQEIAPLQKLLGAKS
jgi:hypothetical protein